MKVPFTHPSGLPFLGKESHNLGTVCRKRELLDLEVVRFNMHAQGHSNIESKNIILLRMLNSHTGG